MKRIALFMIAGLLVAQLVLAQDFWLKKEYAQWTPDEVLKIMKNSPWAKEITVALSAPNPESVDRAPSGTIDIDEGSSRTPVGGEDRGSGRDGVVAGQQSAMMTIEWRSSLPFKEALLRTRLLAGEDTADAAKTLNSPEANYVVAVSGVPLNIGRAAQNSEALQQSALKIDKKDPIHVVASHFEAHGQTMTVLLAFPRKAPIVLEDNEVEVVVKLGTFDAKKKFKLKDMVVNGKLEL